MSVMLFEPHPTSSRCNSAALAIVLKVVISGAAPRGSALQKRLRDREKEMEVDERDRKREKEELEEIRQRLLDEGHPNPDAELRRVCLSTLISMCVCVCVCLLHLSRVGMPSVAFVKVTSSHSIFFFFPCIFASHWSRWRRKRRSV